LEIRLETEIELNSEMRLEAEIKYFRDDLGGHDEACLEMHLEAKIE
jgi:hypothetical protein